jgi:hypothetical protein
MDLYDVIDWLAANVQNGGNYTIVLDKDQSVTPTEFSYDQKTVNIILRTAGGKHTVTFASNSPAYSLFTVGSGVTFTLEEGVTLQGAQNNADKSIVRVAGGKFVMNGGVLTGNKTSGNGGGVYVASGTFTMNNGTISGNSASGSISGNSGGGVYVASGTFTMTGGTISGNSAYSGGGVYVASGTFTMTGGAISGNSASSSSGGGVYVASGTFTMTGGAISGNSAYYGGGVYVNGKFIKSGGVIYGSNAPDERQANKARDDSRGHAVYADGKKRNITARATTAMDSGKEGPSGGWE